MRLVSSLSILAGLFVLSPVALNAQVNITSITTAISDAPNSSANGLNYANTTQALTSFTGGGTTYYATSLANAAFVRRNTSPADANQSSAWYRQNGSTTSLLGTNAGSYSSLLLSNDLTRGSDNTFANGTAVNTGNIERLDFVFTGGVIASPQLSFAVFERGANTVHDGFKIAVITGWDSTNNLPTSYAALTTVAVGWGTTNLVAPFTYDLLRYNTGNTLGVPTSYSETGTQGIGGVYLTLAQLGVSAGTQVFGYSLFGYDVTSGGNSANLVSHANATYYPVNTNGDTGGGGIDLAAVNGVLFSTTPVPEPSTYTLCGAGSLAALAFWRRRRRSQA
jgi:MYXO-CTERM domain-containing protein